LSDPVPPGLTWGFMRAEDHDEVENIQHTCGEESAEVDLWASQGHPQDDQTKSGPY
jgi:hypothetical protein